MPDFFDKKRCFLHGSDYNPEQWLKYPEILKQDLEYMKKAHCNVVSIGMFSWAFLEPSDGVYNFEYMDKIIKDLSDNGIKIILSTPSGAKPRWLAEKYPEVLRVNKNNQKEIYGARHNHCYTSPVYRRKIKEINSRLSKRYADNPSVILWHISNEYGGECHCELCQKAFREYLKTKYDNSLDKLNHAWWSGFWSHNVTSWDEIHSPVSGGEVDSVLTGLYMDWKDFVTYQTCDFMKEEIESVKTSNLDIPVTTNFMGPYQSLDYHYIKDHIDIISWDSYPSWHSDRSNELEGYSIAFAHDIHRCFKNKPFLLMESTPSLTNWQPYNKLKRPGMHKLSSLQAVAHGSDSVQYFQWRKSRGGVEKFHGAVIDHNGKPEGRVFEDVAEMGMLLENLSEIVGTNVMSEVALVYEFRNRWAIDNSSGFYNEDKKYKRTCVNHYREFWKRGVNVDVIGINSDLSPYKVLILPMLYSLSESQIECIEKFVADGGTVIGTYMTGYANETDLCYLGGFPGGKLKDVFGLTADEIDTLYPNDKNSVEFIGKEFAAVDYCELLTLTSAETLGIYKEDFYKGMPAITVNSYGRGKAYYIAFRDTGALLDAFYQRVITENKIDNYKLPDGVSLHTREDDNYKFIFIENYSDKEQKINLGIEFYDMEKCVYERNVVRVDAYGIKVLKVKK